jgi:DNA-binding beta-propeller fold protein YncE
MKEDDGPARWLFARAAIILMVSGLLQVGCFPKPVPIDIVWPLPPDPPRIRYVRPIRASSDVEKSGLKEALGRILLGGQKKIYLIKKPYGVHLGPSGRLFVADTGWGKVLVFDLKKRKFSFLGEGPTGQLMKPACVATDQDGTIYVSDLSLHEVLVYDRNLQFKRVLGTQKSFAQPVGIAINRTRRRVYVVDALKHQVAIFDTDGHEVGTIGKRGERNGEFNYPTNIAVAGNGDIYVTDTFNFRVERFDASGKYLGQWGKVGDRPGMFTRPKGVAIDSDGHVYVVDAAFRNVQIFNPEGKLLLFFGSAGRNLGQFYLPAGIDITPEGTIYVADQLNRRIDVLKYLGSGGALPGSAASAPKSKSGATNQKSN